MRRPFFLLCAALLLLGACGASGSDGAASTTSTTAKGAPSSSSSTTTTAATTKSTTTTTVTSTSAPAGGAAACTSYFAVVNLYSSLEPIATGSFTGQQQAQTTWDAAITDLQSDDAATPATADALDTLAKLTFTVTEDATGVPTEGELIDAFATLDAAYAKACGSADVPTECPAPETLEAEGFTCDSEGNLTPIGTDSSVAPTECPAPETLAAEGVTCDSEGNLTPIG